MVRQLNGEYEAKTGTLSAYCSRTKTLIAALASFEIQAVPRASNTQADDLAKLASKATSLVDSDSCHFS